MNSKTNDTQLIETIVSKETVYPGVIIDLEHWQVTLPNGEKALRQIACHRGASAVVAIDQDDQIILVRQHRVAINRVTMEIPAGKLDSVNEDPFVCAKRELSEETGLDASAWQKLTVLQTTPGFCNERIHMYMASGLTQGATHPDDDEFVAVTRMKLSDALASVMKGEIRDGKTIVGIMMACQLKGLLIK